MGPHQAGRRRRVRSCLLLGLRRGSQRTHLARLGDRSMHPYRTPTLFRRLQLRNTRHSIELLGAVAARVRCTALQVGALAFSGLILGCRSEPSENIETSVDLVIVAPDVSDE